jgi:hypothetical protein
MRKKCLRVLFGSLLASSFWSPGSRALAATPDFTITATNVTMSSSSSSGAGSTSFTLTSVNGYTGSVSVTCVPSNIPARVRVPVCGGSVPPPAYPLAANQVVTKTISLYNSPVPLPASLMHRKSHGLVTGLALSGVLLCGFGTPARARRWFTLTLFALCAFFALAGFSACGASNNYVTPGIYTYTVAATDVSASATVTASFNVTVP